MAHAVVAISTSILFDLPAPCRVRSGYDAGPLRITQKMRFKLKHLSPDHLLADYWQKHALFLPGAIDIELPTIDANELAWLAMQSDVESRLVFTDRHNGSVSYRVEHGPFVESDLSALPNEDWTLLVQDVEKHLPDFRQYFDLVSFVPTWRLDDLMVSIAAPGGSVGPHKDNYDVFLCQGEGARNWMITDDRNIPVDDTAESLSLLMPYEATEERECVSGDVLYVPPGIPHWGVATTFCTTYSIGMRAPTEAELAAGFARVFGNDDETLADANRFYSDGDLQSRESQGGKISSESLHRFIEQKLLPPSLSDEEMVTVLGSVVTDPKAWLDPDKPTQEDVEKLLRANEDLQVHGMALLTWYESEEFRIAFVNGFGRIIPDSAIELVRELCARRSVTATVVNTASQDAGGEAFVRWILGQGLRNIGDNSLLEQH
jgi:50S ribosomal protein L16 3-hydroxylase